MRRVRDWLIALVVMLFGREQRPPPERPARDRIVAARSPRERAERAAAVLFVAAAACALAFPFLYAFEVHPLTQLLGISLGLACLFLAAALIVIGRDVLVTEEVEEPYPPEGTPDAQDEIVQIVEESGESISRKRLLVIAGGAAAGALGVALVTPALSLGPVFDVDGYFKTPWRRGRRLVDETGNPYRADDIDEKAFYTAYPEGADQDLLGSPIVVVRLDPATLRLPPGRASWAPRGIVAYSKICTHAGCAISLYRTPTFRPVEPKPALVCPCHYSTFDPAEGGTVLFGPAGRPLPQLPLEIDAAGGLRAAGNFSGPVGPSWWGVRNRKATT